MPRPHADPTGRKQGSSVGSARRPHATSASAEAARREITVLIRTERPRRQSGNLRHSRRGGERTHLRRRFPRKAVADQFRAAAAMPVPPANHAASHGESASPRAPARPAANPRTPNPSTEPKRCPRIPSPRDGIAPTSARSAADSARPTHTASPRAGPRVGPRRASTEHRVRRSSPHAEPAHMARTPSPCTWALHADFWRDPAHLVRAAGPYAYPTRRIRALPPSALPERIPCRPCPFRTKARDSSHTLGTAPSPGP